MKYIIQEVTSVSGRVSFEIHQANETRNYQLLGGLTFLEEIPYKFLEWELIDVKSNYDDAINLVNDLIGLQERSRKTVWSSDQ